MYRKEYKIIAQGIRNARLSFPESDSIPVSVVVEKICESILLYYPNFDMVKFIDECGSNYNKIIK